MTTNSISSLVYDSRLRGYFFQTLILLGLAASVWWLIDNTVTNLADRGKTVGFGFLGENAGFQISATFGTWLFDYNVGQSSYLDVYFIGIANTFLVAILGIAGATVLGFTVGIMRLSKNFIVRSFATVYIELLRNIPLLLQLFFWYFAVLRALPSKRDKIDIIPDIVAMNITGLYLPAPVVEPGFFYSVIAFVIAIVITLVMKSWAQRRQSETGQRFPVFLTALALIVGVTMVTFWITSSPLTWSYPEFKTTGAILRRGFQSDSGMVLVPEMLAVWLTLTLYTAAFIAEIVRAGILAVAKGQTEAAYSIGMRPGMTLRLIIIPQALRVIIPPLTSQYLNLTKNSSLAVAIAYPELVSIFAGTALNQVGKEIEMIFMMMMVYLTFSIATAAFMNWFNARVKLVER